MQIKSGRKSERALNSIENRSKSHQSPPQLLSVRNAWNRPLFIKALAHFATLCYFPFVDAATYLLIFSLLGSAAVVTPRCECCSDDVFVPLFNFCVCHKPFAKEVKEIHLKSYLVENIDVIYQL